MTGVSHTDLPPRVDLPSYQWRVVEEKAQLDDKIEKLHTFIVSPSSAFDGLQPIEQQALRNQRLRMQQYSMCLHERLALWGVALPFDAKRAAFEYTLIDVFNATASNGLRVALFFGATTAQNLRTATYDFMEQFDRDAMFINGLDNSPPGPAEAAAWRNLARLANATAAAIDAGL